MKRSVLLVKVFSIAWLLVLSSYAVAQKSKNVSLKIDSLFASYNSNTPGVAVAIVKDGKVVFKKAYGMADLSYNIPVTPQTVFNIASVSKQFTAFAIYLLEDEGRLSFEDDVRKYIPELPDYGVPVRIKHMLSHTSGLRDRGALESIAGGYVNADMITTEQLLKLLARQQGLNFTPGSTYGYCNSNYTLLAEIVHRITGKTFSEYTTEKMFAPLGMKSTQFSDTYETVIKNKAESYELQDNRYYRKPLVESNPGPSNLFTTVEDLSKWALNFENPVVGNKKLIERFNEVSYLDNGKKVLTRVSDGDSIFYAKGQFISTHKGVNMIGHGGHTAGFRTYLGRFPDQRLSIIQLSNDEHHEKLGGRWNISDYYVKNLLVEEKPLNATPPHNPVAPTPEKYSVSLNELAGEYYSDELETKYRFEVKEGTLIMKHKRLYDITLKRIGEYKFSGYGSYTFPFEITFTKSEPGKIVGFDISNWGVKNVKFVKQN